MCCLGDLGPRIALHDPLSHGFSNNGGGADGYFAESVVNSWVRSSFDDIVAYWNLVVEKGRWLMPRWERGDVLAQWVLYWGGKRWRSITAGLNRGGESRSSRELPCSRS